VTEADEHFLGIRLGLTQAGRVPAARSWHRTDGGSSAVRVIAPLQVRQRPDQDVVVLSSEIGPR
jgi:hypothetical protein